MFTRRSFLAALIGSAYLASPALAAKKKKKKPKSLGGKAKARQTRALKRNQKALKSIL